MPNAVSLLPRMGLAQLVDPLGEEELDPLADDSQDPEEDPQEVVEGVLEGLFGSQFPPLRALQGEVQDKEALESGWVAFLKDRWDTHGASKRRIEHISARNRMIRRGIQWISAVGMGSWKEPMRKQDEVRVVHNLIGPALSHRIQVASEQRPGFKTRPTRREQLYLDRASAQQMALEYQYDQQEIPQIRRQLGFFATTDGSAFQEILWDPDRGPISEAGDGAPMGEVSSQVVRLEQIRVSSDATPTDIPTYTVIRRAVSKQSAIARYGGKVIGRGSHLDARADSSETMSVAGFHRSGLEVPGEDELLEGVETVPEYTCYIKPLPGIFDEGLTIRTVGDAVIFVGPLLFGTVPVVRWTDGSDDPSYFPTPVMNDWVDLQQRINKILSVWVKSLRQNVGGRFISRPGAFSSDTLVAGGASVIEINGGIQTGDSLTPLQPFSIGNDAKELLDRTITAFEQLSGYNDASRGSFSSEQSGRSILAQREALERVFAPFVASQAESMVLWAEISLRAIRFGYDEPRVMALAGEGRPDVGRALQAEDLDGICDIEIDAESLMPQPRAYKQFRLDDALAKGIITPTQWLQRSEYGFTQDLQTPDLDHFGRAMRVVQALIEKRPPPPVRWQDNPGIHQDALDRHIILSDRYPEDVVMAAVQRWTMMAQLQQAQMGQAPPPPTGDPATGHNSQGAGTVATPSGLPPSQQPMLGGNPSMSAAPVLEFAAKSDDELAGLQFDRMSHL